MKNKLIVSMALLASMSFPSQSEETVSTTEFCTNYSGIAETVLAKRYEGVSASTFYKMADNSEVKGFKLIINMAFDKPDYSTSDYQAREIGLFRDEVFMICIESFEE